MESALVFPFERFIVFKRVNDRLSPFQTHSCCVIICGLCNTVILEYRTICFFVSPTVNFLDIPKRSVTSQTQNTTHPALFIRLNKSLCFIPPPACFSEWKLSPSLTHFCSRFFFFCKMLQLIKTVISESQ